MEAILSNLPFALLFLLCPLMMLFMHRGGHGGEHDHHTVGPNQPDQPDQPDQLVRSSGPQGEVRG